VIPHHAKEIAFCEVICRMVHRQERTRRRRNWHSLPGADLLRLLKRLAKQPVADE
jgi:hypothetical protein